MQRPVPVRWIRGYVDTVNLRSHMPTMKRHQPTSGQRGPPSLMIFIMVDVREYKPRTSQGAKGPLLTGERPLLSLIYKISPCETRGRFCGGASLPHIRKKTDVKALAKRVQDLDKGDIIAGGDLHTWLIFIIDISLFRNRKCNPKEEENGGRRLP